MEKRRKLFGWEKKKNGDICNFASKEGGARHKIERISYLLCITTGRYTYSRLLGEGGGKGFVRVILKGRGGI